MTTDEHQNICIECMKRKEVLSMQMCISCEQSVYNFDVLPREGKYDN